MEKNIIKYYKMIKRFNNIFKTKETKEEKERQEKERQEKERQERERQERAVRISSAKNITLGLL